MTREEKKIDGLLKEYIEKMDIHPEEERLEQTIRMAEKAFYQSSREQRLLIWNFYSGRQRISVNDGGFSSF